MKTVVFAGPSIHGVIGKKTSGLDLRGPAACGDIFDAVQQGVCTEAGADAAMKLGVNYPAGPFEWLAFWGREPIAALLDRLDQHQPQCAVRTTQCRACYSRWRPGQTFSRLLESTQR